MKPANKFIIGFLFSICLLACIDSVAQHQKPESIPDQYRAVLWGLREGLSQGCAYHMLKDVNGFLWIGTQGGLSRFDGNVFKNYYHDPNKSGTINSRQTDLGLVEDSMHNIWIGTDKGLFRYDIKADTFAQFLPPGGLGSTITAIFPIWATKDGLYCLESDSIITRYNIHSFEKKKLATLAPIDSVNIGTPVNYSYFDEHSNSLWMLRGFGGSYGGPPGGGLLEISLATGKKQDHHWPCFKNIPGHHHGAEAMCYDRIRNCLWINSWEGLMQFTLEDKQFHFIGALNSFFNREDYGHWVGITLDIQGRVWLATRPKGIVIYNPDDHSVTFPFPEGSAMQNEISEFNACVYSDRDGITWSGFWFRKGIYQIIPYSPSVKHYKKDASSPYSFNVDNVISTMDAGQGKMLIGSQNGLLLFDTHSEHFQLLTEKDLPGLKGTLIFPVWVDTFAKQAVLFTDGGKFIMDLVTKKCQPVIFKNSAGREIKINERGAHSFKNGLIISGAYEDKERIFIMDGDSGVAHEALSFPVNTLNTFASTGIFESEDGFMFLKGFEGNFTYVHRNNEWKLIHSPLDSIPWSRIVYNETIPGYWVVAEKQLIHYNKDFRIVHTYTPVEGLPDIDIYNLLPDTKGNIWFNTDRSIHQLNAKTGVFSTLTEKDGFEQQNFSDYPILTMGPGGELYLGEGGFGEGFIRISPDKYTNTSSSVYLQSIEINQKPFPLSTGVNNLQELSLKYFQNKIAIETGIIDYYSKGSSHIRYQIEGLNEDWQYGPANYTIRYDGLPPGKYTLLMQSSNAANEFIGPVKTLLIHISPPWWKTWWAYMVYILTLVALIWTFVQYRSRNLKERNILLEEKVMQRTGELKLSLKELTQTQNQLIQREKMASLGELTAGIAHEIQNPLNFVNNFSEINAELIDETSQALDQDQPADARALLTNIKENEIKILYHGKRADGIVKSMLQHSRTSTGIKEPTDINALCDEYLRLSYHGLRAKDKTFQAEFVTFFDPNLPRINIIQQEFGRVLLNLINNAFYAVGLRHEAEGHGHSTMAESPDPTSSGSASVGAGQIKSHQTASPEGPKPKHPEYKPLVTIKTQRQEDRILISIADNGMGIPEQIKDKIFQPFFTTKPTGQGTGLGLSLAYDIVTNGHNGELSVNSKVNEGSIFTILLPLD